MTQLLDVDLLRTLVVAVEAGGLMRAAPRLGRTRSAVSLQVRRLESQAGARLFRKEGRRLGLTPAGELLLGYARRILQLQAEALGALQGEASPGPVRLGAAQDLAERWLPEALARFARARPGVALAARVGSNASLLEGLAQGALDLALVLGEPGPEGGKRLAELPMRWVAAPSLAWPGAGQPLPLALLDSPCLFRRAATGALDAAGVPWRVAFSSPSLPAVWAAVEAGLGLTVRTALGLPPRLARQAPRRGLPALPRVGLWLAGGEPGPEARALGGILEGLVAERLAGDLEGRAVARRRPRHNDGPSP